MEPSAMWHVFGRDFTLFSRISGNHGDILHGGGGGLDGTFCPSANVQGGLETQNIGGLDKYRAKSYRHTLKDRPV